MKVKFKPYKYLIILLLIGFFNVSCTEVFIPDVNVEDEAIVVEGLITNGVGPFYVKLSKTVSFNDNMSDLKPVTGAVLIVKDTLNNLYFLFESTPGNYQLPSNFIPEIGNAYKLLIETKDGNKFESDYEKLLPPSKYDSIRSFYVQDKFIDKNNNLRIVNGADMRVDLFENTADADKKLCRFKTDITIQYSFNYNLPDTTAWHYFCFGWESFNLNSTENLAPEKISSGSQYLKNHSLCFIPNSTSMYGFNMPDSASVSFYLRINQYTLNNNSYKFYLDAKNQLSASGKIFDPVTSQLKGNIRCVNNSEKIVLGLFEVSSIEQSAYVLDIVDVSKKVFLFKVPYVEFNQMAVFKYRVWDIDPKGKPQNDDAYTVIPFTDWWYHK